MELGPPHIISTQLTHKHIILNVLMKRVHLYGGQLTNYLVYCGANDTAQSYSTEQSYIMVAYTSAASNIEFTECVVQLESVSNMLSDKVHVEVAIQKHEEIPTDANLYLGLISPTGKIQFTYWLSLNAQQNLKNRKSQ